MLDSEVERSTIQATPKRHHGAPKVSVFASRSPSRPNPIGFCVVELVLIEDNMLTVRGLDAFEGSPVVDIKTIYSQIRFGFKFDYTTVG